MRWGRYTTSMHIGVDIGGSKILVVGGTTAHEIVRQSKIKTPESGQEGMSEIIRMIEEVAGSDEIRAIAVATASPIDRKAGAHSTRALLTCTGGEALI